MPIVSWTEEGNATFNRWQAHVNASAKAFEAAYRFWRNVDVVLFALGLVVNFVLLLAQLLQISSPTGVCYLGHQAACTSFYYLSIAATMVGFVLLNIQQFTRANEKKQGCEEAAKQMHDLALTINRHLCIKPAERGDMALIYDSVQQAYSAVMKDAPPWHKGKRHLPLPQKDEHKGVDRDERNDWQRQLDAQRRQLNQNVSETTPALPVVAAVVDTPQSPVTHPPPEFAE